jgi:hypothetical protein
MHNTVNSLAFLGHDGPEKICALTLGEITGFLHNTSVEETMSEDQGHIDVVACLPDVDTLTDDDEGPDDVIGIVDIQDVPGALEIYYLSSEACESREQANSLPSTTRQVSKSKSSKKRCLSDDLSDWSKTTPSYTKLSAKGNQAQMKIDDLTKRLHSLSLKEEPANDSIYEYIVKEMVQYAVNVRNEQDFMLTADEVRVFVGFLILTG